MNTQDVIKELSIKLDITQKDAKIYLNNLIEVFNDVFSENKGITLQNFGTFNIREKKERKVYNPLYKKYVLLPLQRVIYFKASPALKEKVNKRIIK